MPEYVYIFKSQDLYKIGRTNNVKKRLSNYSSFPVSVEFIFAAEVQDSRLVELDLHQKYASFRGRGEWFNLSNQHLVEIEQELSRIGTPHQMTTRPVTVLNKPKQKKLRQCLRMPDIVRDLVSINLVARSQGISIREVVRLLVKNKWAFYEVCFGEGPTRASGIMIEYEYVKSLIRLEAVTPTGETGQKVTMVSCKRVAGLNY